MLNYPNLERSHQMPTVYYRKRNKRTELCLLQKNVGTSWLCYIYSCVKALVFLLALVVSAANRPVDYDSDDEFIDQRQGMRQPLIRPAVPATGVPVAGTLDQRPGRNDAWSTRMREKGLDTSEFTYNPSESNRYQQVSAQPAEERSRCSIM